MKNEFINVPVDAILNNETLNHIDILTYLTVRSFEDDQTNEAICSIAEIAKLMTVTKLFANKSVDRLINASLLKPNNTGRRVDKIKYQFASGLKTVKIPYELLNTRMPNQPKSCLIIIRMLLSTTSTDRDSFVAKVQEIETSKPDTKLLMQLTMLSLNKFLNIEVPEIGNPFWQLTDIINWNHGENDLVLGSVKAIWG